MAEIQQWRRKIQPARARTPAAVEADDSDGMQSSNASKQSLKCKVSSYFDLKMPKTLSNHEASGLQLPSWPLDQLYPDPDVEDEMGSVMCRLMSEPHSRLDVRFNASLMRIFEAYVRLKEERDQLQSRLDDEAAAYQAAISNFNMVEKDWQDERQDYKEEVKRLEVLLSKASKRGTAEVTLARQDSKLRSRASNHDANRETIYEFLNQARIVRPSEKPFVSQRATMKPVLQSSSTKDSLLSRSLVKKKSMTNVHAELPFGTPPEGNLDFSSTRLNAATLENLTLKQSQSKVATIAVKSHADTFSASSDEADHPPTRKTSAYRNDVADAESNFAAVMQGTPTVLAHSFDPTLVLPQLLEKSSDPYVESKHKPERLMSRKLQATVPLHLRPSNPMAPTLLPHESDMRAKAGSEHAPSGKLLAETSVVGRRSAMSKASGFFTKLRPQLSVDNASIGHTLSRRFSFEPGDDAIGNTCTDNVHERHPRTSRSLDALKPVLMEGASTQQNFTSAAVSPTTPTLSPGGVPASRIPNPIYATASLARPRQEREDSSSSLLTAIQTTDDLENRSCPTWSSANDLALPWHDIVDVPAHMRQQEQGFWPDVTTRGGKRVLVHTKSFRGHCAPLATLRKGGSS